MCHGTFVTKKLTNNFWKNVLSDSSTRTKTPEIHEEKASEVYLDPPFQHNVI